MQQMFPHLFKSFLSVILLSISLAAQDWVEIKSKNFTVVTDGGEKRGREVALRFEQMREVFGSLILRDKINPTSPLSIVAFKDRKGCRKLRHCTKESAWS